LRPEPLDEPRAFESVESVTTAADCEFSDVCWEELKLVPPSAPRAADPELWLTLLAAGANAGANVLLEMLILSISAAFYLDFSVFGENPKLI
jgi:hypothetical protein